MRFARLRSPIATLLAISLALAASALIGCAQKLPDPPAGITGTITSMLPGDNGPAAFLVQGNEQPPGAVSDKAQVTVGPETAYFDRYGKRSTPRGMGVGTRVSVWFDGPVAESYPVQGRALAVQIFGK